MIYLWKSGVCTVQWIFTKWNHPQIQQPKISDTQKPPGSPLPVMSLKWDHYYDFYHHKSVCLFWNFI